MQVRASGMRMGADMPCARRHVKAANAHVTHATSHTHSCKPRITNAGHSALRPCQRQSDPRTRSCRQQHWSHVNGHMSLVTCQRSHVITRARNTGSNPLLCHAHAISNRSHACRTRQCPLHATSTSARHKSVQGAYRAQNVHRAECHWQRRVTSEGLVQPVLLVTCEARWAARAHHS